MLVHGHWLVPRRGLGRDSVIRKTLESYMQSSNCLLCRRKLAPQQPTGAANNNNNNNLEGQQYQLLLCTAHMTERNLPNTVFALRLRLAKAEAKRTQIEDVCRSCSGLAFGEEVKCDSRDCPVYYSRVKAKSKEKIEKGSSEALWLDLKN